MGLDDDIAILAGAPLFGLMDRDALRLLSFAAERRSLRPGDVLFSRGEPADGGYVVLSGEIAVEPRVEGGTEVRAGRSTLIGQLALFLHGERPADARAVTEAEVMRITPSLMRRMLEEFPAAARAVHIELGSDLAGLTAALERVRDRLEAI